VFDRTHLSPLLDPSKIKLRESCDGPDNPNSTPIIMALDVTGSMGRYAAEIAKDHLPEIMRGIIDQKPVSDPHVMFMGIDDIWASPTEALQVSQFEADIRILEQLRNIYLVGNGGGNRSESYDLAWYFAAFRTEIDSIKKREQKGYLFTFGDEEAPYQKMTAEALKRLFKTGEFSDTTPEAALQLAQQKYHVFHVIIEQGDYAGRYLKEVERSWTRLLDRNVICVRNTRYLTEVILATMRIVAGAEPELVIAESKHPAELKYAFRLAER
jgi:hypothetical protein